MDFKGVYFRLPKATRKIVKNCIVDGMLESRDDATGFIDRPKAIHRGLELLATNHGDVVASGIRKMLATNYTDPETVFCHYARYEMAEKILRDVINESRYRVKEALESRDLEMVRELLYIEVVSWRAKSFRNWPTKFLGDCSPEELGFVIATYRASSDNAADTAERYGWIQQQLFDLADSPHQKIIDILK